jgi:hypothetical protein
MAMSKDVSQPATNKPFKPKKHDEWEVRDAMHTMLRASEIIKDKPLLAAIKKAAATEATEMTEKLGRVRQLAQKGMISDRQMAKMGAA